MHRSLLRFLRCPVCTGELSHRCAGQVEDLEQGELVCGCGARWPIRDGVPRFRLDLELEETRRAFTFQWGLRLYRGIAPKEAQYRHDPEALARWIVDERLMPVPQGSWLLDAGCGSGDKAASAAEHHPDLQILAVDMSETISASARRWRHLENLHFVQADVRHLPLAPRSVAGLWSWGVLHHTPDTRAAFADLIRVLRPGGRAVVWIYPCPDEDPTFRMYYWMRDLAFLGMGHHLPPAVCYRLVQLGCVLFAPIIWYGDRVVARRQYRDIPYMYLDTYRDPLELYRTWVFLLFDSVAPTHQLRHRRAEVLGWFRELGLQETSTDGAGHYWGTIPESLPEHPDPARPNANPAPPAEAQISSG